MTGIVSVRVATPDDVPAIYGFIRDLAIYEKLDHELVLGEAEVRRDLFGPAPRVFCDLGELDGEPVGFAIWFLTYSTFLGRHGIWLEDLFVRPEMRGHGVGRALLSHLAQRCVTQGYGRLEWSVLDWNEPSIQFYKAQGADFMDGWRYCRVAGDALARLGAKWESSSR